MKKKSLVYLFLTILLVSLLAGCASRTPTTAPAQAPATSAPTSAPTQLPAVPIEASSPQRLILATTTSTQDSGLLEYLLPYFEQEYNTKIDVIAVGTGQAIKLGQDGNADVLLVHARSQEDAFMAAGDGVRREDVMYNDFVIVGPEADPAGISGMKDAAAAFTKIADAKAKFISRGDESGTNTKELATWKAAGIEPSGDWYISAGQGMGAVLTMADEQKAYTLSDRATYLARTLEGTDLKILVEGDPILFNPYGVIAVNPNKNSQINNQLANTFIDWLVSLPTQEIIAKFGVDKFGAPLFTPDSTAWRESQESSATQPAASTVALKITGKVANEMSWSEDQVRAMPTMEAKSKNKQGETSTYTGVLLTDLLDEAGVQPDATTVVFVGDDGFTGEVALADLQSCSDCILSFRNQGGFSLVLPGFPGNVQVKGVVEIQVK